jgi:hypothetical protein
MSSFANRVGFAVLFLAREEPLVAPTRGWAERQHGLKPLGPLEQRINGEEPARARSGQHALRAVDAVLAFDGGQHLVLEEAQELWAKRFERTKFQRLVALERDQHQRGSGTRHAALALRFLSWALARGGREQRGAPR